MNTRLPDRAYSAFLFDMDGTLISSVRSAERVWGAWARRHGLDAESFVPTIHGVQTRETLARLNLPGLDIEAETRAIIEAEMDDVGDIEPLPGAAAFLDSLPPARWAVVTSATRGLALRRLQAAGLPEPALFITAEDVRRGKPAPDCFELAARRLRQVPAGCLVFEDAPAGIQAAEAAGADVVVISTTHRHPMVTSHPTMDAYEGVIAQVDPQGGLRLLLRT